MKILYILLYSFSLYAHTYSFSYQLVTEDFWRSNTQCDGSYSSATISYWENTPGQSDEAFIRDKASVPYDYSFVADSGTVSLPEVQVTACTNSGSNAVGNFIRTYEVTGEFNPPPCYDVEPAGWIEYPKDPSGGCATYKLPLTEVYSLGGTEVCEACFAPPWTEETCLAPLTFTEMSECLDLEAPMNDKDGDTIPNYLDSDNDNDGISDSIDDFDGPGMLSPIPNEDGTLPDTPTDGETCDDLETWFVNDCDYKTHTPLFSCATNEQGFSYITHSSCILKETDKPYLCIDAKKIYQETCIHGFSGVCFDNGMRIESMLYSCNDAPDPSLQCDTDWHQSWNGTGCVCDVGYEFNSFGDCWAVSDLSTSTDDELALLEIAQKEFHDNNEITKSLTGGSTTVLGGSSSGDVGIADSSGLSTAQNQITTNKTLSALRQDTTTSNNHLAKISGETSLIKVAVEDSLAQQIIDSAKTNELLGEIRDGLSGSTSASDSNVSGDIGDNSESHSVIMGVLDSASSGLGQITTDYETLIGKINDGMDISPSTSGSSPIFSAVVFNRTLEIDLCDSFSNFYPVFYYVFTLMFLYVGIRIFIFSFLIGF